MKYIKVLLLCILSIFSLNMSRKLKTKQRYQPFYQLLHYMLVFKHSGKCLEIKDASEKDGAEFQQSQCNGNPHQIFSIKPTNGGFILAVEHTNKVITVKDSKSDNGTRFVQTFAANLPSQNFELKEKGPALVQMINIGTRKCLDGNNDKDPLVHLWKCHDGENQKLSIVVVQ